MNRMCELNVHKQHDVGVPSLLDSLIMFCHMCNSAYMLCVCIHVHVCVYMQVFKNGKGSFTQCILVHMHKGV